MALINCGECGKEISDKAVTCPQCGAPVAGGTEPILEASAEVAPPKKKKGTRPAFIVLALILVGGFFWVRAGSNNRTAPPSAGIADQLRQPQVIVSEAVSLKEGESKMYTFTLNTDARVQVQVEASPKKVDVMLMTVADLETFKKAMGKLFGGKFSHRQTLSSEGVVKMDQTDVVPAGQWAVVVMRPAEALLFGKETKATVSVTVY